MCNQCNKREPFFGKIKRPNQEMIFAIRKKYPDFDEVELRRMLRNVRNQKI